MSRPELDPALERPADLEAARLAAQSAWEEREDA